MPIFGDAQKCGASPHWSGVHTWRFERTLVSDPLAVELDESMTLDSTEFHPIEIRYVTDVDLESATISSTYLKNCFPLYVQ